MVRIKRFLHSKLIASSLTETITATIIIMIVFTISIISINNVLKNSVLNNTISIEREIQKITYKSKYQKIETPIVLEVGYWSLQISKAERNNVKLLQFKAINKQSRKEIIKSAIYNDK